jgi:hypothetical protein
VPPSPDALAPNGVTVTRTGGFVGVMQSVAIAPDGAWVYTDRRAGKVERGQLTSAQRADLARLVGDPALRQEARQSPAPGVCADGFNYTLAMGEISIRYEQCGGRSEHPLTDNVLALIASATPL